MKVVGIALLLSVLTGCTELVATDGDELLFWLCIGFIMGCLGIIANKE